MWKLYRSRQVRKEAMEGIHDVLGENNSQVQFGDGKLKYMSTGKITIISVEEEKIKEGRRDF